MNSFMRTYLFSRFRKKWFFIGSIALCTFFVTYTRKSSKFSLNNIRSSFEKNPMWETKELDHIEQEKLFKILSQDFKYLNSGAQCYVFISSDGLYILKFFKTKHLTPKKWLAYIPVPGLSQYKHDKICKRVLKKQHLFLSYKTAFEDLKEETGLIYVHLNKSKNLNKKVRLYNRKGGHYIVNLDTHEFVLQKRAQHMADRIKQLLEEGKEKEARQAIYCIFKHIVHQYKKGYLDLDSGIIQNYGFIGDKVIHFDVGKIVKNEIARDPIFYMKKIMCSGKKLENVLKMQNPSLTIHLDEILHAAYESLPDEIISAP